MPPFFMGGKKMQTLQERLDRWLIAGISYEASAVIDLASGNDNPDLEMNESGTHYATVKAPDDRAIVLFSRQISFNTDGVFSYVYRDPTYTGGTEYTWANNKINNTNDIVMIPSEVVIKVGVTPTDLGELSRSPRFIFGNTSNQGNGGALQTIDAPQIVPPGGELLLVFKNITNGNERIASHIAWAEPEYIEGLLNSQVVYHD